MPRTVANLVQGVTGILDNVDDELLDLKRVAVQGWPALVQAQLARDAHGIEVAAHEPRDLHGELFQIERLDCGRLPARLRPKACRQGESGIDQVTHHFDGPDRPLRLRRITIEPAQGRSCVKPDGRQRLIDLVDDRASHFPDHRKLSRLGQLCASGSSLIERLLPLALELSREIEPFGQHGQILLDEVPELKEQLLVEIRPKLFGLTSSAQIVPKALPSGHWIGKPR